MEAEIDLEVIGRKEQFDYSNYPRMIYNVEEHLNL